MLLIWAAVVVLFVGVLAIALVSAVVGTARIDRRSRLADRLLNVAESGAEVALHELVAGRSWSGKKKIAVPGGSCLVSAAKSGAAWTVTSRAQDRSRSCEVLLTAHPSRPGRLRITAWQSKSRHLPRK
jgi:hypothetical protein